MLGSIGPLITDPPRANSTSMPNPPPSHPSTLHSRYFSINDAYKQCMPYAFFFFSFFLFLFFSFN